MKKRPVVALVGRPNVGKSTLFNRIIRRREAIVDDQPGVTRDRKYQPAEWAGVAFDLIDTGGYVASSKDIFEEAIREQVHYAVEEADVILFVTDVTTGITAQDEEIAHLLQRDHARVIVTVNKVDNEIREADLGEFYRLGLGDPIPVSAMAGRNMGDFLDALIALLPRKETPRDEEHGQSVRIAILGRPNVGKSSYVNAILGVDKQIVTPIPGTTRDAIDTQFRYKERTLILIDTAGLRKRARVHENIEYFSTVRSYQALERCDIALVLVDATQAIADQDQKILQAANDAGKGIVLGINKWDAVEKESQTARKFEADIRDAIKDLAYIPMMFISALEKQRIFKVLDLALAVYDECQKMIPTPELNRFLQAAVEKNHPAAYGTKWVKLNYITQTKANPPVFVIFTNEPRGIKQNYRNYLENQLRAQFGFMGVPIRLAFRLKN
ncbi:MAG TPA: ribosome biogenesis GTPase Der [bacterium]|nr:ribosome biogenesis GTPase Der [bacterium]HQG45282.1 ribosome biogenesis GTPase Der [bacterium]HQI49511.1 ribosome biogenesis GTPase Der [bacterium]HQJ64824.1 ribosome biogenesis GTPase Der [bacterium]